ncbi:MAG: tRNA (guanosine(37)-N1)-methyltransferase TrmD [Candidatus Woykebacteria bacterium RBG_13_40_7b]|uniref:tRNA (guanine-N(1)-)-methyltransferase n=1 Tax=Candidatus Woykebacteria bacterium RBG_13_40_7b TaxID=1802594 RepID=A0A1G1W7H6_9BACT|nr:MAG: tRNA (guanosine(37)-N1)-methyltransferase TrmD [Candidatus Woykebacteria bacterium RBG_13_40_7b]
MRIDILTLFPEMFESPLSHSILKRAQEKGKVKINFHNIRNSASDKHGSVDDKPYGGGVGMVLRADVLTKTLESIIEQNEPRLPAPEPRPTSQDKVVAGGRSDGGQESVKKPYVIVLAPSGVVFNQQKALELAKKDWVILVCGHYEGIDQRFIDLFCDEEISVGDYILTGGEIPAMVLTDSIVRLIPSVLEKNQAVIDESFSNGLLEYPQYTRPKTFRGKIVPEILLSGNHQEILKWRKEKSKEITTKRRPDLLEKD